MVHYNTSILINRPVDQVFDFMTQIDNNEELAEDVVASWKLTDGPVGLGTQMTERVRVGLAQADLTWEITAFELNSLCTYEGDTSIGRTKTSYLFDETGGRSRVTADVYIQLSGLYRIVKPIVKYFHARNRKRYLATIKKKLENGQ